MWVMLAAGLVIFAVLFVMFVRRPGDSLRTTGLGAASPTREAASERPLPFVWAERPDPHGRP